MLQRGLLLLQLLLSVPPCSKVYHPRVSLGLFHMKSVLYMLTGNSLFTVQWLLNCNSAHFSRILDRKLKLLTGL